METNTKIYIGIGVLAVAGIGTAVYFMTRQSKSNKAFGLPSTKTVETKIETTKEPTSPVPVTNSMGDTPTQAAYDIANYGKEGEVPSDWSRVFTDFDKAFNYQRRDNSIWWTAKKSAPTAWVSLADPKWSTAVQALNAKYFPQ